MANSESNSVDILVLGPMVQTTEQGELVAPSRTEAVKKVIEGIVGEITAGDPTLKVNVAAPEDADTPLIVPGVLNAIEKADLVVIDLTGDKPNVAYEAGIVHALGLPHLFVTGDPKPPFYFRPVQHIANLKAQDGYRREDKIHQRLRDRIRDFVAPGTVIQAMNFTDNELTQYYGLPIVDVAGPSGLAAGYFRNAVRRFVRKGGFLNVPCDVSYRTRSLGPGSAEASITTKLTIGHMIAIRPSGELARTHNADVGALARELEKLGLRTKDVTIPKRDGDYEDMRNFGGQLLAHAGADRTP